MPSSSIPRFVAVIASLFLCLPTVQAQNEVPNGGFENWEGGEPALWNTSNAMGPGVNVTATTDAYDGDSALRAEIIADRTSAFVATTMPFFISRDYGFLVGFYRFVPQAAGDGLRFNVSLWNDDSNAFEMKGGELTITEPATEWTQFVVPLAGSISGTALVGAIEVLLYNEQQAVPGTYALLDALMLTDDPGSVNPPDEPPAPTGDTYVIAHEITTASGWFGGDARPGVGPRNSGVGQSVLVDRAMTVERFSFYYRGPFNLATSADPVGEPVTLVLNVRDATGEVLRTQTTDLPAPFGEDWVTWSGLDLDVPANTTLVFTAYLAGGYDVLQVNGGQVADADATYPGGQGYAKDGTSDADMESWSDWSVHRFWDFVFRLEGTLLPDAPPAAMNLHAAFAGTPAGGLRPSQVIVAAGDINGDGLPDRALFSRNASSAGLHVISSANSAEQWHIQLPEDNGSFVWRPEIGDEVVLDFKRATLIGFVEMAPESAGKEVILAEKVDDQYVNPIVVDQQGTLLSPWSPATQMHLVATGDVNGDGLAEITVYNPQSTQVEIWGAAEN